MKLFYVLGFGCLLAGQAGAVTANMQFLADVAGAAGVFDFNVNGQVKRMFCDQFLPNATTSPYVANVSTLDNLTGSVLAADPQALFKYQRVAILVLRAMADPSLAADVVRANRRFVDGVGPLTPGAQALYDYALAANPASFDLSGFKIYTNFTTQELTSFDTGYVQLCKVAGAGITVGTNFTFDVAGTPLTLAAGPAPGGTCAQAVELRTGTRVIVETLPIGTRLSAVSVAPESRLVSTNLGAGTATVTVAIASLTTVTFIDSIPASNFTGFLQICKVAGAGVTLGAMSSFSVAGMTVNVPAGASPFGICAPAVEVPAGTTLITETPPPGTILSGVSTVPNGLLTNTNLSASTATLTVNAGTQTIVTFINTLVQSNPLTGFVQICKVAGLGVALGSEYHFQVTGPGAAAQNITVAAGAAPGGTCGGIVTVAAGITSIVESLPSGAALGAVSTLPNGLLVSSNFASGTATVTVNAGAQTIVTFQNTFIAPVNSAIDSPYQIRYVSNLNLGDSVINITNTGAEGAGLSGGTTAGTTGAFCANVYAFSPDEQMVSCCSCPVTPNGLVSLSARQDLISNTLTPAVPTSLVVKLLATKPVGGTCTGSAATATVANLSRGLAAWATTIHVGPAGPTSTETPFSAATLSTEGGNPGDIGELNRLTQLCSFINANGAGFGVCRSCRLGGLGSGRL